MTPDHSISNFRPSGHSISNSRPSGHSILFDLRVTQFSIFNLRVNSILNFDLRVTQFRPFWSSNSQFRPSGHPISTSGSFKFPTINFPISNFDLWVNQSQYPISIIFSCERPFLGRVRGSSFFSHAIQFVHLAPFQGEFEGTRVFVNRLQNNFQFHTRNPFKGRGSTETRFSCDPPIFILGHFRHEGPSFQGECDGLVPFMTQFSDLTIIGPPFHKRSLILGSFDESLISLRKFVLQTPPLQGREEYFPFPIQVRAKPESLFLGKREENFRHGCVEPDFKCSLSPRISRKFCQFVNQIIC